MPPATLPSVGHGGSTAFSRVQVNDSFGARDMLGAARHLLDYGRPFPALRLYQKIVRKYGRKVIRVGAGYYRSVRSYVWNLLLKMPPVRHGVYDQLYGLQAQNAVRSAEKTGQLRPLRTVCGRYFPSTAAARGLRTAARMEFERGSFAAAARTWMRLWNHPAAKKWRPLLLDHAALAAWLAGEKSLARRLEKRLARRFPLATGNIRGRKIPLVRHLKQVLVPAPWVSTRASSHFRWKSIQGNFSRNLIPNTSSVPGAVMWSKPLDTLRPPSPAPGPSGNALALFAQGMAAFGLRINPYGGKVSNNIMFSFPTCRRGALFVDTGYDVEAFNIASGYSLWRYPVRHSRAAAASAALAALVMGLDSYSCSLSGNRVYAITHGGSGPENPMGPPYRFGGVMPRYALVCLQARSGRVCWRVAIDKLFPQSPGVLIWPAGAPLVRGRSIFLLIVSTRQVGGQNRLLLLRLDARTGQTVWRHDLCTLNAPGYFHEPVDIVPAMATGMIYFSTGQGGILAVHAGSGRIAWLRLTPAAHAPFKTMYWGGLQHRILPWKVNPPLVYKNLLITQDSLSPLRAHIDVWDRWTGRLRESFSSGRLAHAYLVLGAMGGDLYTVGQKVQAMNLRSGRVRWSSHRIAAAGQLAARPFLTRRFVYLPLDKGLLRIATRNGRARPLISWPRAGRHAPGGPGNLLVTPHQLVVVNDSAIIDYVRWRDALAYLQAQIRARPDKPQPCLSLAEAAFRTSHYRLAQNMMGRAARLTVRGAIADAALRNRIFSVCLRLGRRLENVSNTLSVGALFYFQQARLTAGNPIQQARWRIIAARYYLRRHAPVPALKLLEQILVRRSFRHAPFTHAGNTMPAGMAAAHDIALDVIGRFGRRTYAGYETAARTLLAQARAAHSLPLLERVVHRYPDSVAGRQAAGRLARNLARRGRWRKELAILLWLREHTTARADKARLLVALVHNMMSLGHWNQALALARRGVHRYPAPRPAGRMPDFPALLASVVKSAPAGALARLAILNFSPNNHLTLAPPVAGSLLTPVDPDPAYHRYGRFLASRGHGTGVQLTCRGADAGAVRWTVAIPHVVRVALLGYENHAILLASPRSVFALSTATGQTIWTTHLHALFGRHPPPAKFHATAIPPMLVNGGVRVFPPMPAVMFQGNIPFAAGAAFVQQRILAQKLAWRLQQKLGATEFRLVKLFPGEFIIAAGGKVMLYDAATGKARWRRPVNIASLGTLTAIVRTGASFALALNSPITVLALLDRANGHLWRIMRFGARNDLFWLGRGVTGTIYLSGIKALYACRPYGGLTGPLWSRRDLDDPSPLATQWSLDGLIVPTAHGIMCLDDSTGRTRWHRHSIFASASAAAPLTITTFMNQDTLVAMTPTSLLAYSTRRGRIRWKAEFVAAQTPPLLQARRGDPDIAIQAVGPCNGVSAAAYLYLVDQADRRGRLDNGSLVLAQRLIRSHHESNGPHIAHWLLVNHGVVFEVGGNIFRCHLSD